MRVLLALFLITKTLISLHFKWVVTFGFVSECVLRVIQFQNLWEVFLVMFTTSNPID